MTGQVKDGYYLWEHPDGLTEPVAVKDEWVKGDIANMPLYMVEGTITPLVPMPQDAVEALDDVVNTLEEFLSDKGLNFLHPARLGVIERRMEVLRALLHEARGGEVSDGQ